MNLENNQDQWDLSIKPKKGLLDIDLKELWRYRDLIMLFVRRDFVAKYKQSILGPLWFIIQPMLTTIMFVVIFSKVAGISTNGIPPVLFYMTGLVIWNYFSATLTSTSDTFLANAGIFGKVYFPRLATPVSIVISNLIQFGIQFSFLIAILIYYLFKDFAFVFSANLLLIPVLIIMVAAMALGFGMIISSMTTKYRDLKYLITFGVQLWMYATPIIYPLSTITGKYKILIMLNPLTAVVEAWKCSILGIGTVDYMLLGYSLLFTVTLLFFGTLVFNRVERSFMDTV